MALVTVYGFNDRKDVVHVTVSDKSSYLILHLQHFRCRPETFASSERASPMARRPYHVYLLRSPVLNEATGTQMTLRVRPAWKDIQGRYSASQVTGRGSCKIMNYIETDTYRCCLDDWSSRSDPTSVATSVVVAPPTRLPVQTIRRCVFRRMQRLSHTHNTALLAY